MAAGIYGGNYQAERDRQLNASTGLGSLGTGLASAYGQLGMQNYTQQMGGANLGMMLGQQDWQNIDRLLDVGGMVEGQSQKVLDDYMNRFNYYQQRPENQLNQYTAWLNGIPGAQFGTDNYDQDDGSAFGNFLGNMAGNYARSRVGG